MVTQSMEWGRGPFRRHVAAVVTGAACRDQLKVGVQDDELGRDAFGFRHGPDKSSMNGIGFLFAAASGGGMGDGHVNPFFVGHEGEAFMKDWLSNIVASPAKGMLEANSGSDAMGFHSTRNVHNQGRPGL